MATFGMKEGNDGSAHETALQDTLRGQMMGKRERPETIDNQWGILYRDYPEVSGLSDPRLWAE